MSDYCRLQQSDTDRRRERQREEARERGEHTERRYHYQTHKHESKSKKYGYEKCSGKTWDIVHKYVTERRERDPDECSRSSTTRLEQLQR